MWNRTLCCAFMAVLSLPFMPTRLLAEDEPRPSRSGVVRYISGAVPRTLDPHQATGSVETMLIEALFEGLAYRDPETLKPTPGVAASWEISPDGCTYTFHLRETAVWSNGAPVTAHDFARSWRRMLLSRTGCEFAYLYFGIRGARALNTFQANARRILHNDAGLPSLISSLAGLRAEHPEGLGGDAWRRFAVKSGFSEAVAGTKDRVLREALVGTRAQWSASALEMLQAHLEIAGRRRHHDFLESFYRFGSALGVIPKDDHTLVVELEAPQPYFLELVSLAAAAPVPRQMEEDPRDPLAWWCSRAQVVNGPYRVASRSKAGDLRLEKNASYWGRDSIRAEAIEALGVEDLEEAWRRFQKGDVHLLMAWPTERAGEVRRHPGFRESRGHVTYFYRLNCLHPVLRDVRVRRALALALNRGALLASFPTKWGLPSGRFVPLGMPGYLPPERELAFDLPHARVLLEEAGHPLGKGVPPLRLLFNVSEAHMSIAQAVRQQWKAGLGLDIELDWQEWQAYVAASHTLKYDIARAGWIADYSDPATFLDMFVSDSTNNYTAWGSAKYDALVRAAADMTTALAKPEAWVEAVSWREEALKDVALAKRTPGAGPRRALRLRLLREAEAILLEEVPVIPIYQYVLGQVIHPDLRGYHTAVEGEGLHPLRGLYLAK